MKSKAQKKSLNKAEKRERKRKKRADFRARVFKRDQGRCYWCGQELFLIAEGVDVSHIPRAKRATLDHVQPRSRGGSNRSENLVTCCHECNGRRENYPVNPKTGESISPVGIQWFLRGKEANTCGVLKPSSH